MEIPWKAVEIKECSRSRPELRRNWSSADAFCAFLRLNGIEFNCRCFTSHHRRSEEFDRRVWGALSKQAARATDEGAEPSPWEVTEESLCRSPLPFGGVAAFEEAVLHSDNGDSEDNVMIIPAPGGPFAGK